MTNQCDLKETLHQLSEHLAENGDKFERVENYGFHYRQYAWGKYKVVIADNGPLLLFVSNYRFWGLFGSEEQISLWKYRLHMPEFNKYWHKRVSKEAEQEMKKHEEDICNAVLESLKK